MPKAGSLNKGLVGHWSLSEEDTKTGADLVTNGGFDTDTNWTKSPTVTISGGTANWTASGAGSSIFQNIGVTANKFYAVTYTVSNYSSGSIRFTFNGAPSVNGTLRNANGTYTEIVSAGAAPNGNLSFNAQATPTNLSIDNVVAQEIFISDKTPYANTGERIGATFTTDRKGQSNKALSFNGTSDYVDIGTNIDPSGKTQYSISAWAKHDTGAASDTIMGWGESPNAFAMQTALGGFGEGFAVTMQASIYGQVLYNTQQWNHLAMVYDGSLSGNANRLKLYVNGELQTLTFTGTVPAQIATFTSPDLNIGKMEWLTQYWVGDIDDARVYDRALTQQEAKTMYETYPGSFKAGSLSKGLVGHWKLSQESLKGTDYGDSTPYGNDVTIGGTPAGATTDRKGQTGKAFDFNNAGELVNSSVSLPEDNYSVSAWVRLDGAIGVADGIIEWTNGSNQRRGLSLASGGTIVGLYGANRFKDTDASLISPDSTWHHLVVTITGATVVAYVDGASYAVGGEGGVGAGTNANELNIGNLALGSNYLDGAADDIRVYNRIITQDDVDLLFDSYPGSFKSGSLTKSLAGHWSLSQDSLKGADYADLTPYGNDGTPAGTPSATTDRKGRANKALTLNGTSDYVDLSSSNFITDFGGDTKGSISAWFNSSSSATQQSIFGVSKGSTGDNYFLVEKQTPSAFLRFFINTGSLVIGITSDSGGYDDGEWHNVVVTQDGTTSKMYIDGILQADTDSGEWLADTSDLAFARIGGMRFNGADSLFFNGDIDDVRYYSGRALTQAEVTLLYESYF